MVKTESALMAFNSVRSGGGGGVEALALRFFASRPGGRGTFFRIFDLTHLILELHYCALMTFPPKKIKPCGKKK